MTNWAFDLLPEKVRFNCSTCSMFNTVRVLNEDMVQSDYIGV